MGVLLPAAQYMHDAGTGTWLAMIAGMLLFWGLIAWVAVILVRGRDTDRDRDAVPATELLDRRLAAGEITVEDYEARRRALQDGETLSGSPR